MRAGRCVSHVFSMPSSDEEADISGRNGGLGDRGGNRGVRGDISMFD